MSNRYRHYSKRELLGSLHVDYVMSVTDLGLAPKANRWDVLRAFLKVGEARAERLVEETAGFSSSRVFQGVPTQERSMRTLSGCKPSSGFASSRRRTR
jgi:hypothetical protein